MPTCPWCGATGDRLYERGRGSDFVRFRCKDCMAEFDVGTERTPDEEDAAQSAYWNAEAARYDRHPDADAMADREADRMERGWYRE